MQEFSCTYRYICINSVATEITHFTTSTYIHTVVHDNNKCVNTASQALLAAGFLLSYLKVSRSLLDLTLHTSVCTYIFTYVRVCHVRRQRPSVWSILFVVLLTRQLVALNKIWDKNKIQVKIINIINKKEKFRCTPTFRSYCEYTSTVTHARIYIFILHWLAAWWNVIWSDSTCSVSPTPLMYYT